MNIISCILYKGHLGTCSCITIYWHHSTYMWWGDWVSPWPQGSSFSPQSFLPDRRCSGRESRRRERPGSSFQAPPNRPGVQGEGKGGWRRAPRGGWRGWRRPGCSAGSSECAGSAQERRWRRGGGGWRGGWGWTGWGGSPGCSRKYRRAWLHLIWECKSPNLRKQRGRGLQEDVDPLTHDSTDWRR